MTFLNKYDESIFWSCKASRPKGPVFALAPWKGAKMPCPPRRQGREIPWDN